MWMFLRPDARAVLNDKNARASLARYFDVMQNDKVAKFMVAKKLTASFGKDDSKAKLWKMHDQLLKEFVHLEKKIDGHVTSLEELETPQQSILDLKIEIANRILKSCHFCARQCSVNRKEGELGYCKCGTKITVSTIFKHMGEEPELVPSDLLWNFT